MTDAKLTPLERFFQDFPQEGSLLIFAHNHPDPDSISSAAALQELARVLGKARTTIVYGGIIGRAENAHMVKALKLKLSRIEHVRVDRYDRIAMVDTQPYTGNNALPPGRIVDLVIDHHPMIPPTKKVPFAEIRLGYGATATILTEYFFKFDLPIEERLATALLYGIKSETQDLGREASRMDVEAYLGLLPLADKKTLSKIVNSRVPRSYFKFLRDALDNAVLTGNVILTRLGEVENPDLIPEIADLLLRMEKSAWCFVMGEYQDAIYLSIRTTNNRVNAGQLMKKVVKGKGSGGGHGLIAGGKIDVPDLEGWQVHELEDQLEAIFLKHIKKTGLSKSLLIPVNN